MKFKILLALFFTLNVAIAQHVSNRKIYATDIVNKSGTSVFYFPTSLPLASRACVMNADREVTSSSVTSTELGYLSGVTSALQTQINGKQASGSYITALTGDVTATGPNSVSATIAASAVTNAKMANMAANTIKGNNTGGSAAPSDLTATQATAMLNAMVGDSGSGGTKGLVPAPASGDAAASKFLKADGTWATAGGTPSLTSTYVAYGNGSNLLTGTSDFAYNTTNKRITVNGGAAAAKIQLTNTSDGTASTDGFSLEAGGANVDYNCREASCFMNFISNSTYRMQIGSSSTYLASPSSTNFYKINDTRAQVDSVLVTLGGTINDEVGVYTGNRALGVGSTTSTSNVSGVNNTFGSIYYMDATSGNRTWAIPTASSNDHRLQWICKSDASNNTVIATGSLDGVTDKALMKARNDCILFQSDTSNWQTLIDARAPNVVSVATNTTLTRINKDTTVLCNATSGNVTVTGYGIAGSSGWKVTLKKTDASANQCAWASASGAGDGASWNTTTQYAGKTVQFDGTDTWIIGSF